MPASGLTLLLTSVRVAPGLLTRDAWRAVEAARVLGLEDTEPVVEAMRGCGVDVECVAVAPPQLARLLIDAARERPVVWLTSADGDPGLTDAIAGEVSVLKDPPTVEVIVGSYDVPGSALLDVVACMDRLRSPGGCPWDAAQTHETLAPYLTEEAAETVEAIASGDRKHLIEELGDVLLQVAFHARVGEEDPTDPFTIDDVATGLVAKLVRRHPHVFADGTASTPEEVEAAWAEIKAAEKAAKPAQG